MSTATYEKGPVLPHPHALGVPKWPSRSNGAKKYAIASSMLDT